MTPERLRTLLDTYGADARRWPTPERQSALELLSGAPLQWQRAVHEADLLDGWLDSDVVEAPDEALMERVLASRAAGRSRPRPQDRWRRLRGWWTGAGLIGVGLAGTVAGATAVTIALRVAPQGAAEGLDRATAFSAVPADWSDE